MARSNTGNVIRFLALGALTIGVGTTIGYYVIGGQHSGQPTVEVPGVQESPVPPSPKAAPVPPKPVRKRLSSDYNAPGAPRIHIVEDKTSSLNDSASPAHSARQNTDTTNSTDIPTPDVEASQEGSASSGDASHTAASATARAAASSDTPSPKSAASTDAEASQAAPATASAAPDTNNSHAGSAPPPDSEATQTGGAGTGGKTGGHAQYRVQAGSFADAGNARDYVNSLHDQGYDANLHTEHQGEKTVYKVQVGAFRNRSDADQAAAGFRRSGVPVTVSPANP